MSPVSLSTVKNELKTIGCKLKSQLDGTWAIHEPKGVRIIVPTLEAVQDYYRAKAVGAVSPQAVPANTVVPESDDVPLLLQPEHVIPAATKASPPKVPLAAPHSPQVSGEQQLAMNAVSLFIRTMQKERLQYGLNFLHSEIRANLIKNGCPDEWLAKAHKFAEGRLDKFCHDNILYKRPFINLMQKNDVMYFDGRYAGIFVQ